MSTVPTSTLPVTVGGWPPKPKRFTVTEFHRMAGLGLFLGRRPFLMHGVIWEQDPMNPPHADGILLTTQALRTAFGAGWVVRAQLPLQLDEYTDPMPDFAVVPGVLRNVLGRHPTTASLVVEIADTTFDTDTTVKAERYATANIPDYWVLDMNCRRLLVFRDPDPIPDGGLAYRTRLTFDHTQAIAPLAAPNTPIAVADLLP